MSDYYHHFLTSMSGGGGNPPPNQHGASIPVPQAPVLGLGTTPMSPAYPNLGGYFNGYAEPIMFSAPKAQRSRRKSAPGLDHIKHRRTRSGCYTCRSRRVKCDETHPVCERCRKGNRECVYPEPTPPKGSVKDSSAHSQQESPTSSRGDDDDDENGQDGFLTPIMDEDEEETESAAMQSSIPTIPLPSSASATSLSFNHGPIDSGKGPDGDVHFYLNYYRDNITHYHYSVVNDSDKFFQEILTGLVFQDEGLLYAVVGFAAYHHTLQNPIGEIKDFLHFYNRSVTLLLGFLKRKERHTDLTLLTILQLATIEEYLGDWVNLMGHQKAALEVLTELYTPQTIMQNPVGRMILTWYTRFDVFTGIMGSSETMLPQEWFTAYVDYYETRAAENPTELSYKIEGCSGRLRMISMEMSLLFGRGARQKVTEEEYTAEHCRLYNALHEWKSSWDPALENPEFLVTDLPMDGTTGTDRVFQPLTPGLLFRPPFFASTILTCEWNSIALMHGSQGATEPSSETMEKLRKHAYVVCEIIEAVETWPLSPAGSLIIMQPCLGIAALFIHQEEAYRFWIRKKFALLERMGYISPRTMRLRMAELFRDGSCLRWWLPNDEGFTPMLQSIRAFADERNATAVSTQSENLRQIRSVFSRMDIRRTTSHGQGQLSGGVNTMLLE
ncbi:hypothetical protein SMACR_00876 [Sordaria macrospora]|nr:hypothetical protein SMACR_00876 [Sordaria macrospora]WPJ62116.1 hypothetical protein SMAC4_00876 [Sordaria macrospora]